MRSAERMKGMLKHGDWLDGPGSEQAEHKGKRERTDEPLFSYQSVTGCQKTTFQQTGICIIDTLVFLSRGSV